MKRKKTAAFFLAILLVLGLAIEPTTADAAEEGYKDEVVFEDKTSDFKTMWKDDGTGTAPIKEGYVFGGWYIDNEDGMKEALSVDGARNLANGNSSEVVYAKYVPSYVLSVKVQHEENTSFSDKQNASVRIISSIDSKNYKKVGFDVYINNNPNNKLQHDSDGDGTRDSELETTTVYTGLIVKNEEKPRMPQTIFGKESEYISVWKLTGTPDQYDAKIIKVTPYWITMDGTKVLGLSKFVHIEDGYKGYVNIPINLTTGEEIAAGQLQMKYDPAILKLAESSEGVVYDKAVEFDGVFKASEMAYHDDGNGTITFVGNAETVNTLKNADDIFANIRFQIVDTSKYPDTKSESFLTFQVDDECFCDWDEKDVNVNAWDIQH